MAATQRGRVPRQDQPHRSRLRGGQQHGTQQHGTQQHGTHQHQAHQHQAQQHQAQQHQAQQHRTRQHQAQQHRAQPHELVRLVSRLMFAQAGVTSAIGLAYLRRNITWLLFVLMVAVAVALLAGLIRSGTHAAWVAAVTCESTLTLIGLVRVTTVHYLGGTLLAIATLGVLIHPAVGRAFAAAAGRGQPGLSEPGLAENTGGG